MVRFFVCIVFNLWSIGNSHHLFCVSFQLSKLESLSCVYVCKRILIDKLCSSFSLAALLFRTEICIVCSKIAMLTLSLTVSHFLTHLLSWPLIRSLSLSLFLVCHVLFNSVSLSQTIVYIFARSLSSCHSFFLFLDVSTFSSLPFVYTPSLLINYLSKFVFSLEARTRLNTEIYNYYVLHESVTQGYMICTVDIRKWECYSKPLLIRFPGQLLSMTFSPCSLHLFVCTYRFLFVYIYVVLDRTRTRERECVDGIIVIVVVVGISWRAAVRDYYKCY